MKKRVYLVQVNNLYSRNAFLPYSVGLLRAYAEKFPEIKEHYDFKGYLYLREHIPDVIERLKQDPPDVVGISCYIWNFRYSMAFAKAVQEAFPDCLIVAGGPHIPVNSNNFFKEHPYVDIVVHYEGEVTFKEILLERLKPNPQYSEVGGLSFKLCDLTAVKTANRERISDLDEIPSPYLEGCFDELMQNKEVEWHPSQETNRGCVFQCRFCSWGTNLLAKLKKYSTERLIEEIKWFRDYKTDLLYNCDANWGILPRDLELTKYMAECKQATGFPNRFRAAYAKNSNERVFEIAQVLSSAGMNKGVTLSFQSLDEQVLINIARKNIKMDNFKELMGRYNKEGIATYSEIIVGLPGETYDTFANGIDRLLNSGQHSGLSVYTCEILPNAEMGDPAYQQKYGIKTQKVPVLFFHGTPSVDPHQEIYELIVETNTLSAKDWMNCQMFSWIVQGFHCLGLTKGIAAFLYATQGISYRKFYERLLKFMLKQKTEVGEQSVLAKVWWKAIWCYINLRQGKDWGVVDQRFGDIIWPVEEWAFLHCVFHIFDFCSEITKFLTSEIGVEQELADQLVIAQHLLMRVPTAQCYGWFNWNIPEVIKATLDGESCELKYEPIRDKVFQYQFELETINAAPTWEGYAREVVWYGRKGGKFMNDFKVKEDSVV